MSGTVGPVPESRACAGSKPHRPADQLACAPRPRAAPTPGPSCRRCFLATLFPWRKNAPDGLASASRYGLWMAVGSAARPPVYVIKLTQEWEITPYPWDAP